MDGGNRTKLMYNAKWTVISCFDFLISLQINFIFSVNEIAAKLQTLENSLINNDLLHSCTIRGVTNDWYEVTTHEVGTVAVKGF